MEAEQSIARASVTRSTIADALNKGKQDSALKARARPLERVIQAFLLVCGVVSIFTTIGFTIVLGRDALRFFATTEWLNANKGLVEAIGTEETIFKVRSSGTQLVGGEDLRIGIFDDSEVVRVLEVIDQETIVVERGVRDTAITDHPANAPLFIASQPTLTEFFTKTVWAPQVGNFGVLPLLSSTIRTSIIAMLVAVPLGLGAAIYLSEYANPRVRAVLKPLLEVLAGIPTVVYGYFALTLVTPLLRLIFGNDTVQIYNVFSASLVIGILITPTIATISEDALRAVPNALREASYGLGATRLETVFRVLLPAALSGIAAAMILGISRAVGETMVVLIAAGAGPNWTFNNFEGAETMAGHIARISTGDISYASIDYNSVYAIGLTLFVMTLLLNFASAYITKRFREVY